MPKKRDIPTDTIGSRLRVAREKKKMTLAAVGKACEVSAQAVAQWEYGSAEPSIDTLCTLSKLLDVKLSELLGGDVEPRTLGDLADKLEEVIALMPLARGAIVDVEARTAAPHDGLYLVTLKRGERAAIVGRLVWPREF
jgi:transcriptional regulator with XRE-family HTH domain